MDDASASALAAPLAVALALAGGALAAAALFLRPHVARRVRSLDVPVSPVTSPVLRRLAPQPPYSDTPATKSPDTVTQGPGTVTAKAGPQPGVRVGPVHASHRGGAKAWPENTLLAFRNAAGIPARSSAANPHSTPASAPVDGPQARKQVTATAARSAREIPTEGVPPVCRTRMIELDVQQTRDGHLVVIHNLTVDSTTDGTGLVSSFTLEELRQLDAAYRFSPSPSPHTPSGNHAYSDSKSSAYTDSDGRRDSKRGTVEGVRGGSTVGDAGVSGDGSKGALDPLLYPYRNQGIQIPLLSEALEIIASHGDLIVYLDFKTPEAIEPALAMAEQYGLLQDRTVVGAVPPEANRELLRVKPPHVPATPDINTMILLYVLYTLNLMWLMPLKHEIVGTTVYRWGIKVLDSKLMRAFRERGRLMAVFGDSIDGEAGQMECLQVGCDFLVSDRPDVLWETMNAWHAAGCPRNA